MPQSQIWFKSYVYRSLLVTWGQLEVIWWLETQNLQAQSTRRPKKKM